MFIVTVCFEIKPAHLEDFTAAMLANARISVEQEPGCLQFDVAAAPEAPGQIFLYEVYTDRAAFDQHLASTHFQQFDGTVRDWVASKAVATYQRLN